METALAAAAVIRLQRSAINVVCRQHMW